MNDGRGGSPYLQDGASADRLAVMSNVTQILNAIEQGERSAAEQLLPLVYVELRKLAAEKLAQEKPGQTLQATALVHEAYLRLAPDQPQLGWDSRAHFFAAAAEAMRRILIERVRRRRRHKHGGGRRRVDFDDALSLPVQALAAGSLSISRLAEMVQQGRAEAGEKAALAILLQDEGKLLDAPELYGIEIDGDLKRLCGGQKIYPPA